MSYTTEVKSKNKSKLSYTECVRLLMDSSVPLESLSNDDLDSLYRVGFGHWSYHMSRHGYIVSLTIKRKSLFVTQYMEQLTKDEND